MAAIRPDWQTFRTSAGSALLKCRCGDVLHLSTQVRAHWEQGHFDTPDPCAGGHDWVTRVRVMDDGEVEAAYVADAYDCRIPGAWEHPNPDLQRSGVFCARSGCEAKASDALLAATT